jgi:hypothetical protein
LGAHSTSSNLCQQLRALVVAGGSHFQLTSVPPPDKL